MEENSFYNGSYDYSGAYDYDDGGELTLHCDDETPLAIPILFFFISAVGLLANFVVIYIIVILREYKKTVTNVYILQLAIADFLFLFVLPFEAATLIHKQWLYGVAWCKITESIRMLNYYSSVMFLTMMSFDRFLAINFAMNNKAERFRSKTFAAIFSAVTWCLGCLCVVYVMLKANVVNCKCLLEFGSDDETEEYVGNATEPVEENYLNILPDQALSIKDMQHIIYSKPIHCSYKNHKELSTWILVNFVVAFLIPLVVICLCYTQIIRRISKPVKSGATSHTSNRTRKRVTYMVIALVAVFLVCWLPYYAFNLARINDLQISKYKCDSLVHFTLVLAYLNSALNPFFYTFIGTNIKKRWKSAISRTRSIRLSVSGRSHYSQGSSRRTRRKSSRISITGNAKSHDDDSMSQSNATKHTIVMKQDSFPKSEENKL